MASSEFLLALDQGTTSTRAILLDHLAKPLFTAQQELKQSFPADGWVEHDPTEIWQTSLKLCAEVLKQAKLPPHSKIVMGITNQRETTILWDKKSGKAFYPAIVWQDRRTADFCHVLIEKGWSGKIQQKTGLLIDPYFSATKIRWILDHVEGLREKAKKGLVAFGTIDSFLLWHLTGGKVHATDPTNASRTSLYNIHDHQWDQELLALFNIPAGLLPEVRPSSGTFGVTQTGLFDRQIAITGIAGDQQAALIGQACFQPGMIKSTYGTGCFMLMNTGENAVTSQHRLLTTIGYQTKNHLAYATEGSIFVAGAAIQWLRDGLKLIGAAGETERLAASTSSNKGVYFVPAFTGLGAPYWDPKARGAVFGLTRDVGIAEIVRSALEAVCYQTKDLLETMRLDGAYEPKILRVDGGMTVNDWLMQFLANILGVPVERPQITETTALGAAYLAGLGSGFFSDFAEISHLWKSQRLFEPKMATDQRLALYAGWQEAVNRIRSMA